MTSTRRNPTASISRRLKLDTATPNRARWASTLSWSRPSRMCRRVLSSSKYCSGVTLWYTTTTSLGRVTTSSKAEYPMEWWSRSSSDSEPA